MFDNSLSVELALHQSSNELGQALDQPSNPLAPAAHLSNSPRLQGQLSLHSPELLPYPKLGQASELLPTLGHLPGEQLNPAQFEDRTDTLLGDSESLSQPLVGILDTGFNLEDSLPNGDRSSLGNGQIYLGYDWVEGDRNPLISTSNSHGSQVLEAFSQAAASHSIPSNIWLGRAVGSGQWAASLVEFVATAKALGHENAVANLSFDLTEVQADGSIEPRTALSQTEIAALEFAQQQGVVVVLATGNSNTNLSALALASQQFDNILTVGAAEQTGAGETSRAAYSNYGEGLSLLAEVPTSLTGFPQGTSLAATQATQAVQTLWQQHPQLSYSQIIQLLKDSATDLQRPGWDSETGHGLLNLDQALRDASQQAANQTDKQLVSQSQPNLDFSTTAALSPWQFTSSNPQYLERALALDVGQVTPGNGTTNIDTQASIRVQFASEAVDPNSLSSDSFKLEDSSGNAIAASLGSDITGGVISLTPEGPLNPFSTYNIVITNDLLNTQGEAATPFSTSFTTGAQGSSPAGFRFDNQDVLSGESRIGISSIAVGPDGNVYASDILGNILRYNLDPSTGIATSSDTVFAQDGAQIVGITFDPNATATDLQLWVTYAERDNTGFSGTISKLELPAIAGGTTTKQDYITGLPNSIDLAHQPNGITFGPDGKLYQTVGGVASLGGTPNWGVDESLLSAAVIVADVNSPSFPTNQTGTAVNVQTVGLDLDSDPTTNNYDPFATNAPVQLFATGLRNAYDLAWHSNGSLYSGINQNSLGSIARTPESPDGSVPSINAKPNEMLALIQEGNYYGHPNPSRDEYVLNGGNPTAGVDPREVTEYPVGVQPNPNFDASLIYDTRSIGGTSPNGLTEYTGSGELNGQLLVSFFSGPRTLQSFELGADGLVSATQTLQNPDGSNLQFRSPLDVAVHPSGRIYVAAFGFGQNNPNGSRVRVLSPVETAGVIVTPTNGTTEVSEGGLTDSYTVALATQPSGAVTIAINPNSELSSDLSTLSFNPANWNIPQAIAVSAVDDSDVEGLHSGSISHSIVSGSGDYDTGLAIASLTATITDNDSITPGLEIIESGGNTTVTEGGNGDNLSLRLTAEPEDDVILTLIPDGQLDLGVADSGTVDLTFTPSNWNQAQAITVNAVDDSFVEGNHSGDINYSIASADEEYEELAIATTTVSITDNEIAPSITILPTDGGTEVSESGLTDIYQISMSSQPTAPVTFSINTNNEQIQLNRNTLTFSPSNWQTIRSIQVSAIDDNLPEGDNTFTLTHSATSADPRYNDIAISDLNVNVIDNDVPASIIIIPTDGGTEVSEAGLTDIYQISMTRQPTAPVTFSLSNNNEQIQLNRNTLTFSPSNWQTVRNIRVTAVDDNILEGDNTLTIAHSATSTDPRYNDIAIANINVNVIDNDEPASITIIPTNSGTEVSEAGLTDIYQISMGSQPTAPVTFSISTNNEQIQLNRNTLTFSPSNWQTVRNIKVTAVDDNILEGDNTFTITHSATSTDPRYNGISISDIDVTVIDNDEATVGGQALFVAGSSGLTGSDAIARDLLISKGYSVTVVDDDVSQTSDANGQDLILISQTIQSPKVNTKFTGTAIPVIVWESFLYDDLGMANSVNFLPSSTSINLTNNSHPLAAGLPLGLTPINNANGRIGWGDPSNSNVISIANTGNADQLTIFGYETGVLMENDLIAPAKRVGLSFWEIPDTTGNNEALLEAAIDWARS